ncbi:DUF6207 family protein [Streptomyces sp. NPDC020817]|uniref:DUF6207 family protein n=1 Tax=Streptomyces sp. NPDC020817 TaxID=3365095 RepID=UPI0037A19726
MTNGGCTENSQCLCIELRGLVDGSGGSDAAEPSFHADHDLPGQHHWRLGRRGTFGCNGGSGHRDRDGGCAPTPWAGGTGPPENRLASTDVAAVMEPIDEQYSAEPGLAVLDITGGDEDTVQAVMAPLEECWATSGAPPSTTSPRPAPTLPSRPPGSFVPGLRTGRPFGPSCGETSGFSEILELEGRKPACGIRPASADVRVLVETGHLARSRAASAQVCLDATVRRQGQTVSGPTWMRGSRVLPDSGRGCRIR